MRNSTFIQDIREAAGEEPIEAIVINSDTGKINEYYDDEHDRRIIPLEFCNRPLTEDQAAPLLNYHYDSGFGSMDCHDVHVYTPTRVIYVHEYDGATTLHSVPRNPCKINQNLKEL